VVNWFPDQFYSFVASISSTFSIVLHSFLPISTPTDSFYHFLVCFLINVFWYVSCHLFLLHKLFISSSPLYLSLCPLASQPLPHLGFQCHEDIYLLQ
jgi:hypothetical protein